MRNLGPASAWMLSAAGINSVATLQALGSVAAYRRVLQSGQKASLNLLWALEGALTDRAWQDVAREDRLTLMLRIDSSQ